MEKIDHRKIFKAYYSASKMTPKLIDVQAMSYLNIDGQGRPSEPEFQEAASTLYPVAYTLKFMIRSLNNVDFHVMPLEVIWNVNRPKKEFTWKMLIMQPDLITGELVHEAITRVQVKNPLPALNRMRFEKLDEGLCVQFLHVGPYEGMNPSLEVMLAFIQKNGCYAPVRNTHDIYLNDSRKTKPENLKAIMRLPVRRQE